MITMFNNTIETLVKEIYLDKPRLKMSSSEWTIKIMEMGLLMEMAKLIIMRVLTIFATTLLFRSELELYKNWSSWHFYDILNNIIQTMTIDHSNSHSRGFGDSYQDTTNTGHDTGIVKTETVLYIIQCIILYH